MDLDKKELIKISPAYAILSYVDPGLGKVLLREGKPDLYCKKGSGSLTLVNQKDCIVILMIDKRNHKMLKRLGQCIKK